MNKDLRITLRDAVLNVTKVQESYIWEFIDAIVQCFSLSDVNTDAIENDGRIKVYPIHVWLCTDAMAGCYAIYLDDKAVGSCSRPGRKYSWEINFLDNDIHGELFRYMLNFVNESKPSVNLISDDYLTVYTESGRINIDIADEDIKHVEYTNDATIYLSTNDLSRIGEALDGKRKNSFYSISGRFDDVENSSFVFGFLQPTPDRLSCVFLVASKEVWFEVSSSILGKICHEHLTLNVECR